MNEITRKAANALVAAVDFFQGALAAEAQAGDAKQVQLDALADQLRDQIKTDEEREERVEEEISDLRKHRDELMGKVSIEQQEVARLRELLDEEQKANIEATSAWANVRRERDDALLECKNLKAGLGRIDPRSLFAFIDAARTLSNTIILVSRTLRKDPRFKRFVEKLNAIDDPDALFFDGREDGLTDGLKSEP